MTDETREIPDMSVERRSRDQESFVRTSAKDRLNSVVRVGVVGGALGATFLAGTDAVAAGSNEGEYISDAFRARADRTTSLNVGDIQSVNPGLIDIGGPHLLDQLNRERAEALKAAPIEAAPLEAAQQLQPTPIPTETAQPINGGSFQGIRLRDYPGTDGTDIIDTLDATDRPELRGLIYLAGARNEAGEIIDRQKVWYLTRNLNDVNNNEDDITGWMRSDLVAEPEGELLNLTEVLAIPLAGSTTNERLLEYIGGDSSNPEAARNVDLARIQAGFEGLINGFGQPREAFNAIALQMMDSEGRVFNQAQSRAIITLAGEGDTVIPSVFFQDGVGGVLAQADIPLQGTPEFSARSTPQNYLRFGTNVLFDYDNASLDLLEGMNQSQSIIDNVIVGDSPFPLENFEINGPTSRLIFDSGATYELTGEFDGYVVARLLSAAEAPVVAPAEYSTNEFRISSQAVVEANIAPELQTSGQRVTIVISEELTNAYPRFAGSLRINNVPFMDEAVVAEFGDRPFEVERSNPGFTLEGALIPLDSAEAISVAFEQALWNTYNKQVENNLIEGELLTLEEFMLQRSSEDFPQIKMYGLEGEFYISANAPIVTRMRGVDNGDFKGNPGVIETQWGSYIRSKGPNGELIIDVFMNVSEATRPRYNENVSDPNSAMPTPGGGTEYSRPWTDSRILLKQIEQVTLTLPFQTQGWVFIESDTYYPEENDPNKQIMLAGLAANWEYVKDQFAGMEDTYLEFNNPLHQPLLLD